MQIAQKDQQIETLEKQNKLQVDELMNLQDQLSALKKESEARLAEKAAVEKQLNNAK